jgi:signal transduction histidine kinase
MFVIIVILGLSVMVGYFIFKFYNKNEEDKFSTDILRISNNIQYQTYLFIQYIQFALLRTTIFINNLNVTYIPISVFNDLLHIDSYPQRNMIELYAWMQLVHYDELRAFQTFYTEQYGRNFTVTEYNITSRQYVPAPVHDFYFPMTLIEPSSNLTAAIIGLDFYSPLTRILILDTLNNTNATGTRRTGIARNTQIYSYGILINQLSVINTNNVIGILSVLININNIITGAIQNANIDLNRSDIDLFVFDITQDGYVNVPNSNISLLYKENNPEYAHIWHDFDVKTNFNTINTTFIITNRVWNVFFKFNDVFIHKYYSDTKYIISSSLAVVVCVILCIIFLLCHAYIINKRNAELEKDKYDNAKKMLNYVNHEMRNPLNVINGLIDLQIDFLLEKQNTMVDSHATITDEEVRSALSDMRTVNASGGIMTHIVNDILDISKLEEGKMDIELTNFDLNRMLDYINRSMIPKIREKINIKFVIDNRLQNVLLRSDKNRLIQILLNFLYNAIKFTINGSITLRITEIKCYGIRFEVHDTGRGIPDNAKHKIFQRFQQTETGDASRYGGIGLGLYLCKMLTNLLNGKIGFESKENVGSTFWIEIPTVITQKKIEDIELTVIPINNDNINDSKEIYDSKIMCDINGHVIIHQYST